MGRYIVKRLIFAVVTIFVVTTLTFFLMNMVPGGPFTSDRLSDQAQALIRQKYGLDQPVIVQFGAYLSQLLHGDLGTSIINAGYSVNQIIADKFPVSFKLGIVAIAVSCLIGIPLGILAAYKRGTVVDRVVTALSSLFASLPGFVLAVVLLYAFGMWLHVLPTSGLSTPATYILPVAALSVGPISVLARITRAGLLDVLSQDSTRFLRAKGMSTRVVLFKHALRNAAVPIITTLGPLAVGILVGNLVVETVFSIPGLGSYLVKCISQRDYPVIMGTTIFYTAFIVVVLLVVDLLYCVIDPRVKLDEE
ncbi:MAG: ABC transporter permease [Coriobacteriia bacterium]|nr:ABC transporter permease [Coriobacteriia bacterium]MBS5478447.1 ABC transporter permease [Coriobacteriia bacterium]